jgi:EXPERA (EXPanded EBP superfamily)
VASGEVSLRAFGCALRVIVDRPWFSDSPGIYALLVLYGASTATTTYACIAAIIEFPTTSAATIAQKAVSLTSRQRVILLVNYVPFFIIPLVIAVDMALRLQKLASAGVRAQESSKEK